MLKYKCTKAVRLAFFPVPIQASNAVTQVPIFWPSTIGIALASVTEPVSDNACKIPTEAEELCNRAVMGRSPQRGHTRGWKNTVKTVPSAERPEAGTVRRS